MPAGDCVENDYVPFWHNRDVAISGRLPPRPDLSNKRFANKAKRKNFKTHVNILLNTQVSLLIVDRVLINRQISFRAASALDLAILDSEKSRRRSLTEWGKPELKKNADWWVGGMTRFRLAERSFLQSSLLAREVESPLLRRPICSNAEGPLGHP